MSGINRETAKLCVGNGWGELIDRLYDVIEPLVYVKVEQVKEKFGGLRIYVYSAPEEVFALIEKLEKESLTVCDVCGKDGKLVSKHGWWRTRCEECLNV